MTQHHTTSPYDTPEYFTENRGHFPLTEVLSAENQKHGGRVKFVLNSLLKQGLVFKNSSDRYVLGKNRTKKIKWLDVAAGTAPIARLINNNSNLKKIITITSSDQTDVGINTIQLKDHTPLEFVKADINNLPFKSNTFDIVTAYDILEHLPDPILAVKECKRVLKKGGFFHAVVPNPYSLFSRNNNPKSTYDRDPTHIFPPIVSTTFFKKLMSELCFCNIIVTTRGHKETEEYFNTFHEELFKPTGGNHIYASGFKK